ncbi:4'-phosphopantetheinyl transferase family protein [Serratia sp. UGAL515B_01]|uniref:4'-phosphopantetheinyl transferase family protein n=1 Tax=Serratia sp. UGAL515B_01 TaxID=2986763 RepID=UPI002955AF43|nr:4'-phosphopantetheinyl transferase superfamily protein [Serratia sp. UGAL515B_01]WON76942.1 4'-phosphopantetheinyl transferase superfamily protein [Serratia sp. UGAL515B_01]
MACHFIRWEPKTTILQTHRLPNDLIEKTVNFSTKRCLRFLQGRILLAEIMFYLYGIPVLPPIITAPTGRPCFADSYLPDFSLAYAGNTIGVLLSLEGKVGLDIEVMRARSNNLQQQYCSIAENAWVAAQYDRLEAETQLWSIRQSVLKLSGLGNSGQGTLELHPFSGHLRSQITPNVQVMSDAGEYLCWACAREHRLDRLTCWQYNEKQGIQKSADISSRTQPTSTRFLKLVSLPPVLR